MRRVLVIGSGGAGKSVFARRLATRLEIPVVHLDLHYWRPGWVEPEPAEWRAALERLMSEPTWILDGNYGGTLEQRIDAADTVILLDVPRRVCLWRLLKRRFAWAPRPDVPPGCPERLSPSFVAWVWSYPATRRPGVLRRLDSVRGQKSVYVLHSGSEIERFLDAARGNA